MDDGSLNLCYRAKGITPQALEAMAAQRFPEDFFNDVIWKLFTELFSGVDIKLDLCVGKLQLKHKNDFTIETMKTFPRKLTR
jgi:hypothetical protein